MRVNFVKSVLGLLFSLLFSYAIYSFSNISTEEKNLLSLGGFLTSFFIMLFLIALRFDSPRTTINARFTSAFFLGGTMLTHIILAFTGLTQQIYITVIGFIMLFYIFILYSVARVR